MWNIKRQIWLITWEEASSLLFSQYFVEKYAEMACESLLCFSPLLTVKTNFFHKLINIYLYKSIYMHKGLFVVTFLQHWSVQWTFSKPSIFQKEKPKICKIHLDKMANNTYKQSEIAQKVKPISFNLQEKRQFHCYGTASVPKG